MTALSESKVLQLGKKITVVPIIHGSGDFALAVRKYLLAHQFDCVAVPLPPSFQPAVEEAILQLPAPTIVVQRELPEFLSGDGENQGDASRAIYVPIDPCQGVIAALRVAMEEHLPRAFIDLETNHLIDSGNVFPDPYALKQVTLERFAAAVLPSIRRPEHPQRIARIQWMATRLHELEAKHESILCLCSLVDWPWIREAYHQVSAGEAMEVEEDTVSEPVIYQPEAQTLLFMLGELPFITGLYERARVELESDENLSVDGVKELLLAARRSYKDELQKRARKITPQTLKLYLKYVRNLALIERRMTPDLYTLVIAAKQMVNDTFALHVAEQAREYPYTRFTPYEQVKLGIERVRLPNREVLDLVNRLPGVPLLWRSCDLQSRPEREQQQRWEMRWNPYTQCSWPPEDERIEEFRTYVADRAKAIMGVDLAKVEKFTTSLKDGLDIRETLRNWHTGELYVKNYPPTRGRLDCVVMLFDTPADPREYAWRTTWFAEHENESTLAFYATDFHQELVGPGIALATYGGAMFLFPPRHVPDIWRDARFDFADTLEDRLLAAACFHAEGNHIAVLSPNPPGATWRSLAKHYRKQLVHVPLGSFSVSTVEQLRLVHVLNGHQVRSYAAHFIRKA